VVAANIQQKPPSKSTMNITHESTGLSSKMVGIVTLPIIEITAVIIQNINVKILNAIFINK
jgi:hypothetical protein